VADKAILASAAAALLLVPAAPAHATHSVEKSCSPEAALLGFSDSLDKTTFAGTPVAGLSALALTGRDRGLALVDNIGTTPARVYGLDLKRTAVTGVTLLKRADGSPYTGTDFDGEGLIAEPGGRTILASSEREPSIRRFRLSDGREIGSLPVPSRFQVAPAGQAATNQTFEALAATPDHRVIFAGMEGPLAGDGDGTHRILRYEGRAGGVYRVTAEYAYRTEPGIGLVELVALGGDRLLAVERGFTAGVGNSVRVFQVSATGATDVSGVAALSTVTDPRAWLGKELLADIADCPPSGAVAKQPQPNPLLDNIEAAALGAALPDGRRVLHLLSDDNGSGTTGSPCGSGRR
jgi:hypothetical protein